MDADKIKRLAPIRHEINMDLWRVPLQKIKEEHTVFVGEGMTRVFNNDTLPNNLKTKMVMIAAGNASYLWDDATYHIPIYTTKAGTGLEEIGWQITATWFCLCLNHNEIENLKGHADG